MWYRYFRCGIKIFPLRAFPIPHRKLFLTVQENKNITYVKPQNAYFFKFSKIPLFIPRLQQSVLQNLRRRFFFEPLTEFDIRDGRESYHSYYLRRYIIDIKGRRQPLLLSFTPVKEAAQWARVHCPNPWAMSLDWGDRGDANQFPIDASGFRLHAVGSHRASLSGDWYSLICDRICDRCNILGARLSDL